MEAEDLTDQHHFNHACPLGLPASFALPTNQPSNETASSLAPRGINTSAIAGGTTRLRYQDGHTGDMIMSVFHCYRTILGREHELNGLRLSQASTPFQLYGGRLLNLSSSYPITRPSHSPLRKSLCTAQYCLGERNQGKGDFVKP